MVLGFKKQFVPKILDGAKIHTIREDKTRRWKKGMEIHFATGVRTKDYDQFKGGECTMVQEIKMNPSTGEVLVERHGQFFPLSDYYKAKLIEQDGFDSEDEFWEWFNEPFEGVLIHWTNYFYA